jgi:Rod binding domain-containing protein
MNIDPSAALLQTGSLLEKKPSKLADAARQFEALMIGEMLKSARAADSEGWLGSGSDSSEESAMGVAETQFAQAIAGGGGLGLAKSIERAIANQTTANPAQAPAPPA